MNSELKVKLDKIFEKYSNNPKLGIFKPSNRGMNFERRYELLKNEMLEEIKSSEPIDNDVLDYIDNLVDDYKRISTES